MGKSLIFAMAAILALGISTPSEAKPRPTVDSADICWNGSPTDKGCGGLICYCCYDDGCWICNKDTYDCVWDDSYRADKQPKATDIAPPPPAGIKPPWSKPPKGSTGNAPPPAGAQGR